MSNALISFSDAFRQVYAKSEGRADTPAVGTSPLLATFGTGSGAISFTRENIEFTGKTGKPVKWAWVQLDLILPADLSLASDKLNTFTDMDVPAGRIAEIFGLVFAIGGAGVFAYFIFRILNALIFHPMIWLDAHFGIFGDILDVLYAIGIFVVFGWWLLAVIAGIFAAGGAFSKLSHWLGLQVRPLIRVILAQLYGKVDNALHIINQDWVSPPWNPQAKRALDLVFIGVKLRRRGLS